MNPRFRPHLKHRFTVRDENFGFLLLLAIVDVFAILVCVVIKPTEYRVFVRKLWIFTKTYGEMRITVSLAIIP